MDTEGFDLAGIIGKLMENGDAAEMVERLKASVENNGVKQADRVENTAKSEESSAVSSIIDSEQLAEKLPQVMSAIAPLIEQGTFAQAKRSESSGRRNDLLRALRPYLNDGRRGMIDKIMTLSRFTGVIDLIGRDISTKGK